MISDVTKLNSVEILGKPTLKCSRIYNSEDTVMSHSINTLTGEVNSLDYLILCHTACQGVGGSE